MLKTLLNCVLETLYLTSEPARQGRRVGNDGWAVITDTGSAVQIIEFCTGLGDFVRGSLGANAL